MDAVGFPNIFRRSFRTTSHDPVGTPTCSWDLRACGKMTKTLNPTSKLDGSAIQGVGFRAVPKISVPCGYP